MFKLGILICDHLHPDLQPDHQDYPRMIDNLFKPFKNNIDLDYYFVIDGKFPNSIYDCDAYMTSGSKSSVNDRARWIERLEEFVRELYQAKIPFVGICFGHQLIAKALGGKVEKSDNGWGVGVHTSKIAEAKNWMTEAPKSIGLVVSHQDQISELPKETKVLATNDFCPFSMIQVGESFIGIQGHPEFSRVYSADLMELRKNIIPEEIRKVGRNSLEIKTNSVDVARWIINFIQEVFARNKTLSTGNK